MNGALKGMFSGLALGHSAAHLYRALIEATAYGLRWIVELLREGGVDVRQLVATGGLPPEVPLFHLIRAVHMAGRCIDCGLCEEACPVDIPLRLLYRKVNGIVKDLFGYETGVSHEQPPFSLLGENTPPEAEPHLKAV